MILYETAYAKINLFLDVTGRRTDGYHNLFSCMQTVGLADTIHAQIQNPTSGEKKLSLTCSNPALSCDEKNLAYRAADVFLRAAHIQTYDIQLHIEKRIPISAGLGGGSSDAAAVLRLLNRYYKQPFSLTELCALGKQLGADVPFCITGGTCRCEGVGEILTPIPTHSDYTVLVAKSDDGISTREAFRLLDQKHGDFSLSPHPDSEAIYTSLISGDVHSLAACTYNIFEDVIFPVRPEALELKRFLEQHGALCARMSGSGPSVFGIFVSDARAEVCAASLRQRGFFAAACRTIS